MTERDYASKIALADRLVNDPDTLMDAALVWRLMDEIAAAGDDLLPAPALVPTPRELTWEREAA